MRAVSVMLVVWLAPLLAGAADAGAPGAEASAVTAAKDKARGKGKGESDGPGAVPRTGPRSGKPPRPVMARQTARHPGRRSAPGPRADGPPAHLLRSGFRVTSTGSELVLQTSAEVGLETRGTAAAPSFVLRRCRALRANDRRSLDTRYFATAVTGVALHQRGRDLVVRVTLREAVKATPRKEQGPGETWSWIVAFAGSKEGERAPDPSRSAPTATAAMVR